jgi:RNA polymerase sigma factor (sigma-70 family)
MMNIEAQRLETIYRDTFPQVAKVLHSLGADLTTARDLFHDAMIIYLEKGRDHLPAHASARQYLVGIARILWFKQYKQDRRQTSIHQLEHSLAAEQETSQEKKSRLLLAYLRTAGETCLKLLQAFYYDQLPMADIAEKFHYRSAHSATVQKYKCLEKLREKIRSTELYEETIA